ncbi:MAG: peptidylprolyl isomerase [Acidimicrobiaceae bacterium]|nr:peptidylprolyl isomerase [Acidimicrobiaceae bacterium]
MSTEKRARQKFNRASRIAAAQAAEAKARSRRRVIRLGALAAVVVVVLAGFAWLVNGGDDEPEFDPVSTATTTEPAAPEPDSTTTEPATTEPDSTTTAPQPVEISEPSDPNCPAPDKSSPRTLDFAGPQPMCINPAHSYTAVFDTSEGEIIIDLDTENTPNTTNNFVTLARWGYYDGTTLFRTDPSIDIIQGGSPHTNTASDPGPGYTIPDEPTFSDEGGVLTGPYRYLPGQLVMARSAGPDSSGAQFFFTTGPNTALLDSQGTYIVFGQTDQAGLGVMQDIIGLHQPDDSGLGGRPSHPVTVNSVTILVS